MFTQTLNMHTEPYNSHTHTTTPVTKTITTRHEDTLPQLQHCFQHAEWSVFEHQDLSVHTEAVLSYIKFCMGNVTVDKHIWVFPKPWMNGQDRTLLKATLLLGLETENYTVLPELTWREESRKQKQSTDRTDRRIESHLSNNNPW